MNLYILNVMGAPQGKGRPRFTKGHKPYTPAKTRAYEEQIARLWHKEYGYTMLDGYLGLEIIACFGLNKTDSHKTKERKILGQLRPDKKPDGDNIIKIVADALNGVAYHDDKQITTMYCRKIYGHEPHVEIRLHADTEEGLNDDSSKYFGLHTDRP